VNIDGNCTGNSRSSIIRIGLVNITGCGDLMEGNVAMPEKSNLTGRVLGPLSSDPTRLMIRFSKDFGFKME
jgi:hypothetical protein